MGKHDHWHPVALSRQLKGKPLQVQLHGQELCLFRMQDGKIGAVSDKCLHRGMSLSCGTVVGDRVQCPYHGWCYSAQGKGESPASPRLQVQTEAFETKEILDAIWIRPVSSEAIFPSFSVEGFRFVQSYRHRVQRALPLVLDNFSEVEHTPTTHILFGYSLEGMPDVTTEVELGTDFVTVTNRGLQRPLPGWLEFLMGISGKDVFVDKWTTRFSPVHSVFDHWWENVTHGQQQTTALRVAVFFTPVTEECTDVFTFLYAKPDAGWRGSLFSVMQPVFRWLVDREIRSDQKLIEQLNSSSTEMVGMKLSRFDKALAENRKRISRIYEDENDGGGFHQDREKPVPKPAGTSAQD